MGAILATVFIHIAETPIQQPPKHLHAKTLSALKGLSAEVATPNQPRRKVLFPITNNLHIY